MPGPVRNRAHSPERSSDGVSTPHAVLAFRYLCPRATKRRLQVDPETLLPKLPSPEELRPYPTTEAVEVSSRARASLSCPKRCH